MIKFGHYFGMFGGKIILLARPTSIFKIDVVQTIEVCLVCTLCSVPCTKPCLFSPTPKTKKNIKETACGRVDFARST